MDRDRFKLLNDRPTYAAPLIARIDDDIDDPAVQRAVSNQSTYPNDLALVDSADRSQTALQRPLALVGCR